MELALQFVQTEVGYRQGTLLDAAGEPIRLAEPFSSEPFRGVRYPHGVLVTLATQPDGTTVLALDDARSAKRAPNRWSAQIFVVFELTRANLKRRTAPKDFLKRLGKTIFSRVVPSPPSKESAALRKLVADAQHRREHRLAKAAKRRS